MRGYAAVALGLACALTATAAPAVQIDRIDVSRAGPLYRVAMRVKLDAPPARAWAVFSEYENLPRIHHAVREVRRLDGAGSGAQRLLTEVRVCVSFYCRVLQQEQDMRPEPGEAGGRLSATVLPQSRDLKSGHAVWNIRACGGGSCLDFDAELEPRFWVPPLIGPWLIQRKLREEAIQTSEGIERLARETAPAAAP